jgi:transposase-like protein
VRSIFAQPDAEHVHEQHARIVAQLEGRFPEAAALLDGAGPEMFAFTSFPKEHWRQLWSNNSLERLNKGDPPAHRRRRHRPRAGRDRPPGRRPVRPSNTTNGLSPAAT